MSISESLTAGLYDSTEKMGASQGSAVYGSSFAPAADGTAGNLVRSFPQTARDGQRLRDELTDTRTLKEQWRGDWFAPEQVRERVAQGHDVQVGLAGLKQVYHLARQTPYRTAQFLIPMIGPWPRLPENTGLLPSAAVVS